MSNFYVLNRRNGKDTVYSGLAPASATTGSLVDLGTVNTDGTYDLAIQSDAAKRVVMILPELLSYGAEVTEENFVISTGDKVRCYDLQVGFTVEIPTANITATNAIAAGTFIACDGSTVVPENTSAYPTAQVVFRVLTTGQLTMAGTSMTKIICEEA